jgi:DNA-binding CsgD family transcriptional regulator
MRVIEHARGDRGEPTRLALIEWAAAEAAWLAGRPREALAAADRVIALGLTGFPTSPLGVTVKGWALLDLGHPVVDGDTGFLPLVAGARPELDGIIAMHARDFSCATASFDRAAALWEGQFARMSLRCRWGAAEAARRGGDSSAVDRLLAVEQCALVAGVDGFVPRIQRSLRLAGVNRSPAGVRSPDSALTTRQREILRLVARGRTTREIALRLGVSAQTVESQIGRAMRALGVRTRREAAIQVLGDADTRTG